MEMISKTSTGCDSLLLAPASMDGKWGFVNTTGDWAIKPEFGCYDHSILGFEYGLCALKAQKTGKYGLVNANADWVVPPLYKAIYSFNDGMIQLHENQAEIKTFYGVDNKFSSYLGYSEVGDFNEGLAFVSKGNLFGFINKAGDVVIEPSYKNARSFSGGLAAVDMGDTLDEKGDRISRFGFINHDGQVIIQPLFEFAFDFVGDYCVIVQNSRLGLINKSGEMVIEPSFEFHNFSATLIYGLLAASLPDSNLIGLMSFNGNWIVEPKYDLVGELGEEGIMAVRENGHWGFINCSNGEVVIKSQFEAVGEFSEGIASAKLDDKFGYVNQLGAWIILPTFVDTRQYSYNLAAVNTNSKYGFIDSTGKWVIKPQFDNAGSFALVES